tara:strand:- start:102 stop:371 length:270 start_codon:yes stop_codon:yes gene_type:complete
MNLNETMKQLEEKAMENLSKYDEKDYVVGMEHVYKILRMETGWVRARIAEEEAKENPNTQLLQYYVGRRDLLGSMNDMISMKQVRKDTL